MLFHSGDFAKSGSKHFITSQAFLKTSFYLSSISRHKVGNSPSAPMFKHGARLEAAVKNLDTAATLYLLKPSRPIQILRLIYPTKLTLFCICCFLQKGQISPTYKYAYTSRSSQVNFTV